MLVALLHMAKLSCTKILAIKPPPAMNESDYFSKARPRKYVSMPVIGLLSIISTLEMLLFPVWLGCGDYNIVSEKGSLGLSAGDTTQTSGLINVARGQLAGEKFWRPWEPSKFRGERKT